MSSISMSAAITMIARAGTCLAIAIWAGVRVHCTILDLDTHYA